MGYYLDIAMSFHQNSLDYWIVFITVSETSTRLFTMQKTTIQKTVSTINISAIGSYCINKARQQDDKI